MIAYNTRGEIGSAMAIKFMWLFVAGGLGAVARALVTGAVQRVLDTSWPIGTLVVNVTGCFLFGWVASWTWGRWPLTEDLRWIVLVGFVGSFTTFSTFAHEAHALLEDRAWASAAAQVVAHNALGLAAMIAGFWLGRS